MLIRRRILLKMPRGRGYKKKRKITRKPQRKRMALARQPYVETKIRESETQASDGTFAPVSLNDTSFVHIPDCFERMSQGDQSNQMSGRWIFSKWLTTKLLVDYDDVTTNSAAFSYTFYQGWFKNNLNPEQPASGPVILEKNALEDHIKSNLDRTYEDSLAFGDMRKIQIISKRVEAPACTTVLDSQNAPINHRKNRLMVFKWTPMRKIRYNACRNAASEDYFQCNSGNWVPFLYIQKTPHTRSDGDTYPSVRISSRHWFTDA